MVDVCLLGCGGMMPLPDRALSAMLFRHNGSMILLDCGEGTQVSIRRSGWGFKSIDAICFTHYHADHIAGLPGLLLTIANSQRTEPLTLLGPPGLAFAVRGLMVIAPVLPFELILVELSAERLSEYRIGDVFIKSIPADHNIPCLAYTLDIKRLAAFNAGRATELGIPVTLWRSLQNGNNVEANGRMYSPEMVLGVPRKGIKVVYCVDTRPAERLTGFIGEADILVCEGFYGDEEKRGDAVEKKHMIFSEAALLAKNSGSKELWLTHYSPSLKEPEMYIDNAKAIFENTLTGKDMMKKSIRFEDKT